MDAAEEIIPAQYGALVDLTNRQLAVFPEHKGYIQKRFAHAGAADFVFADEIAQKIFQIADPQVDRICEDYRWLSEMVLEEELNFRRTGRYRLSTFEQADREVYSNREFMTRYMNGLLASQIWWSNHTEMLHYFRDDFIGRNAPGFSHLEIGPGHGLFLSLAASSPNCGEAQGWDISDASLANTREALDAMQLGRDVTLRKINLFDAPNEQYSSITFSEVMEHLERPQDALKVLYRLLRDDGRLFINAPVNSPAPDHLFLFETPEQLADMIADAGFTIEGTHFAPCTGSSLPRARKLKLSISAGVIARKK